MNPRPRVRASQSQAMASSADPAHIMTTRVRLLMSFSIHSAMGGAALGPDSHCQISGEVVSWVSCTMIAVMPDAVPFACISPRAMNAPLALAQCQTFSIRTTHPTTAGHHEEQLSEPGLMGSDFAAGLEMKAVHVSLALAAGQGDGRRVPAAVFADRLGSLRTKGQQPHALLGVASGRRGSGALHLIPASCRSNRES